uniref:Cation-transporting ATPase n=1 Tax=Brassica oleracea var. oleracea TaxID=109376 RepID=A0A0D3E1K0_BRAOL
MTSFRVGGKVVDKVDLRRKKHWAWRLDVWPFAILYATWLTTIVPSIDFTDAAIALGGLVASHILVLLFTAWSVDFKCFVQFSKVNSIDQADACKVTPAKFSGSKEVVPLHFRSQLTGSASSEDMEEIFFDFRKQRFIYSKDLGAFSKLPYPTKETFGHYLKCTGHGTEAKVATATEKWGRNVFDYPQPTFQKLMKENCMEPFFVFQVFCVGLWFLDEFWYYSVFTLFMLFTFESTMAKARLKALTDLRRVRVDSQTVMVYRCGKWAKLLGTDLLPGDVVSIGRPSTQTGGEDKTVPADMLLLVGSAIVNEAILTGESTPQWKVPIAGERSDNKLSIKKSKNHVLFGGTKILQHSPDKSFPLKTPDGGCLAVVLRTEFETSQGKLMRTILFSTERVTANSWESGLFILFLVVFAVIAAGYVLVRGLEDPTRSKYKLLLGCSLIITSVIPPELPMELSIAVNTSLLALSRRGIFCTEPFRIPFAGKVDLCCFDKTGTLTSDDMEFRGVGGLTDSVEAETDMSKVPVRTLEILASCHALVFVDNKLVGDPLEKAALKGIDWSYKSDEKALPRKGNGNSVQIMQRYHFASHLKRMSVIVCIQQEYFMFVKGAPETIQDRLVDVPASYIETYKRYTRQGSRVLALAFKRLPDMTTANIVLFWIMLAPRTCFQVLPYVCYNDNQASEAREMDRDAVESDLTFAGFAVFNCPIRSDSAAVLLELKNSSHDLVMITGDQALTACHVASQVHIVSNPVLILGQSRPGEKYKWVSPDEKEIIPYSDKEIETLAETHDLCSGGDSIEMLQATSAILLVIPFVKVFARVAPQQKELILTTFKDVGRGTLMCGDGTNDVGALKQAHVGVALLNAVPPSSTGSESSKDDSKSKKPKPPSEPTTSKTVIQNGEGSSKGKMTPENRRLTAAELQRQKLKKMMDELNSDEGDGRSAPLVKLGDASMASPFTAKHASVAPVTDIIRQGRSTLVTTLQMFKILGLNCLATAYVLSVMYLDGVKLGDVQATISGVLTAAFFLFISHARPLQTLSAERPHPSVFSLYLFLSLLGQFAVHITFLIYSVKEAEKHMPEECIEPDATFHPNLVNTVSYMVSMMLQVATFAVNYMGHPFNQSIRENKPFFYALIAGAGFFTVIASDLFRDLNDSLKLVPLPEGMRDKLLLWALLMFVICYSWERFLRWAFPGYVRMSPRPIRLKRSTMDPSFVSSVTSSGKAALVKVKLEHDKHVSSEDDSSSSGKALVAVKLEKEEEESGLLVTTTTRRTPKRKRLADLVERFEKQRTSQRGLTTRWNTERIDFSEQVIVDVLKEKGASFDAPVSRAELRASARGKIGDTGLLDHLLKHIDGNVTPGGADRFRRCHDTQGTMQYWLESADLLKIKRESGVPDPNWVPPPWWKLQGANGVIKIESGVDDDEPSASTSELKEEMDRMKSEIKELVSELALIKRECGIPDPDLIPLAQWKIQSSSHSHDSSAVSSKLREELDQIKSDIKKLVSKPKLPDHAEANEKLFKEIMSWKVKTDKQIAEISKSLTSTQGMVKELVSWKDKVEQKLVGISNNVQANGTNSFNPAPQSWEHILHNANLDDFTVNGFEPWDVDADLINVLPEAVRPDKYSLPPNARKSSFQDHMWFEEQSVLNSEMQRTESCMTRGDSRSSNQDKAEMPPGPRADIDDTNIVSQETLKELVNWKAKAEQQLMEMSDAVRALQG